MSKPDRDTTGEETMKERAEPSGKREGGRNGWVAMEAWRRGLVFEVGSYRTR